MTIVTSNIIMALGRLLSTVAGLYMLIVIASAVITWFPVPPWHPAVKFLRGVTEPVYERLRRFVPGIFWQSGIDITPWIVLLALYFLNAAIFRSLIELGMRMR